MAVIPLNHIRETGVMANSILSAKVLQSEAAAIAWVEARVWPEGPVCPHCGGVDRIGKMRGKATRIGLYKCYQCRKQFTVKVGTVFEDSHVPMNLWLQAMYLLCSSQEGHSEQPAFPHLGRHSQNRMVHVAPHPRGHARCRRRADGRCWQDRRDRRNFASAARGGSPKSRKRGQHCGRQEHRACSC